jgi:biotin carboxyl carrier protein
MAHAYTPGLKVMPCTLLKKKRLLPIPGKVLAVEGQQVDALDVVAQTELPGKVFSVNVANRLAVGPGEIGAFMSKKEGDSVKKGEAIAENKPMLKWFKTTIESPIDGTVDTVSSVTGQVLLREPPKVLPIKAYVKGKVVEVISNFGVTIEAEGTFIQGIFGVGGETNGEIVMAVSSPDEDLEPEGLKETHTGKIVIGGKHASLATIKRAIELGVNALVVGGIHDRDLRQLLGYDIGVAVTGTEKLGITLIVTEGFGMIPMAEYTFKLLSSRNGEKASVSGATQIRAGVMRPEIIVPGFPKNVTECKHDQGRGWIEPGDPIRIIREPHFGVIGTVKSLPPELTVIGSESHARVLEVLLDGGEVVVVPRANIEVLEK